MAAFFGRSRVPTIARTYSFSFNSNPQESHLSYIIYTTGLLVSLYFISVSFGQQNKVPSNTCASQTYHSVMMEAGIEDHLTSNVSSLSKTSDLSSQSDSNALAVVIYEEKNLFPHQQRSRSFKIAGHEFNIEQDWNGGGVAAVVWDAAVVLGEYLTSNSSLVKGKRVLELGAGTGLAGMVAATLGADVVVTERERALSHLETTISKNRDGKDWSLQAAVLDWTDDLDSELWGNFDLVIGADIIYIESTFPHLLKTLRAVSPSPSTQILLSCRIRYDRDLKFLHMMKKFFIVEEIFYHSELDIKIFAASLKS